MGKTGVEEQDKVKKSKKRKEAEDGILAAQYTLNGWFVKIYPAYEIDLVKFAFVKKNTKGEGFDVYMTMDKMDIWADDILSFRLKKVIEAEKAEGSQYPKAYKYITGENGAKSIGICPSTTDGAFATINGCSLVNGKKVYANVPVDYDWLRITAKWFKRTSAKAFDEMAALIVSSSKRDFNVDAHDAEEMVSSGYEQEQAIKEPANKKPAEKKPEPVKSVKETKGNEQVKERITGYGEIKEIKPQSGNYCMKATNSKGEDIKVIFLDERIKTMEWNKFKEMLERQKKLSFAAQFQIDAKGNYYFMSMAV